MQTLLSEVASKAERYGEMSDTAIMLIAFFIGAILAEFAFWWFGR